MKPKGKARAEGHWSREFAIRGQIAGNADYRSGSFFFTSLVVASLMPAVSQLGPTLFGPVDDQGSRARREAMAPCRNKMTNSRAGHSERSEESSVNSRRDPSLRSG